MITRVLLVVAMLTTASFAEAQNLKSGGVLKAEQAIYDVRHYALSLTVDIESKSIVGSVEIDIITKDTTSLLLFDLVHLLKVKKVWVNGKAKPFSQANDLLRINCKRILAAGKVKVKVDYGGKPGVSENPPWSGGFTWSEDSLGNPWVAITCESEGAKVLFPCKDHPSDEPNEGADLIITVPKGLYVAGPGLLVKQSAKGSQETFHWRTKYTINNYSILFNIGKYLRVSRMYRTSGGHSVPLEFYVLQNHRQHADRLLNFLERAVKHEEKFFGEYPWIDDKIAVCETPHLGMEHQTLNAYGNKFRYTKSGGKDLDWLLLHELGHEWWGNKVTANDWADMWIQEGICAFGDALYTEEYEGKDAYLLRMQATAISTQNHQPVVPGKNLDSDAVYQPDIYGKGAFFMHTLRYMLGDDKFFSTLKKLATDGRYTFDNLIDTDDVEGLFSGAYGESLKPVFDLYLRSIMKLEVIVRQVSPGDYELRLVNMTSSLPIDVVTDNGKKRMTLRGSPLKISSTTAPVIDPDLYYLKKVIYE
ncbi:MAG: M1 family metallopeptidase [Chryseolinea sp.]